MFNPTQKTQLVMARRLMATVTKTFVQLGNLLEEARVSSRYGQDGFKHFCDAIPIHTRKAYQLTRIAERVRAGAMTEAEVTEIGWSKAAILASIEERSYVVKALAVARNTTVVGLQEYLKTGLVSAPKRIVKVFELSLPDAEVMEAALLLAGAKIVSGRIEGRSDALMSILRAYSPPRRKRVKSTLETAVYAN